MSGSRDALILVAMLWCGGLDAQVIPPKLLPEIKAVVIAPERFVSFSEDPESRADGAVQPAKLYQPEFTAAARSVLEYLEKNYPQVQRREFLGAGASRSAVLNEIARLPKARQPSLLLVYFAGHGFLSPDGTGTRTSHLAMEGCDLGVYATNRFERSISLGDIADILVGQPERSYVVLLDACHSGGVPTISRVPYPYTNGLGMRGVAVASSGKYERSFKALFTRALLMECAAPYVQGEEGGTYFVDRLHGRMKTLEGYDSEQQPHVVMGISNSQFPPLHQRHATLFVTVNQTMPTKPFSLILAGRKVGEVDRTVWPPEYSEGNRCFVLSVPAEPITLLLSIDGGKRELKISLSQGQLFAPLHLDLAQYAQATVHPVGRELGRGAAPDIATMEKAFREYVQTAAWVGAPLDDYAVPALRAVATSGPSIDMKPFMKSYLEVSGAQTSLGPPSLLAQAAALVADGEKVIPLSPEGARIANFMAEEKVGGWRKLGEYCTSVYVKIASNDPDVGALIPMAAGKRPEDYLSHYLTSASKYAVLAGDPVGYFNQSKVLLAAFEANPNLLSNEDLGAFIVIHNNTRALLNGGNPWLPGEDGNTNAKKSAAFRSWVNITPGALFSRYKSTAKTPKVMQSLPSIDMYSAKLRVSNQFLVPEGGRLKWSDEAGVLARDHDEGEKLEAVLDPMEWYKKSKEKAG